MTALFWLKPTSNGQSSYWVVRCDCGKYEIRKKLGKWHKKYGGEDMCEVCEREREMLNGFRPKASLRSQGERLLRWAEEMRQLGLNDAEITAIRCSDRLDTKGKTAEEIRQALRNASRA
jgi:hypothetical protein